MSRATERAIVRARLPERRICIRAFVAEARAMGVDDARRVMHDQLEEIPQSKPDEIIAKIQGNRLFAGRGVPAAIE